VLLLDADIELAPGDGSNIAAKIDYRATRSRVDHGRAQNEKRLGEVACSSVCLLFQAVVPVFAPARHDYRHGVEPLDSLAGLVLGVMVVEGPLLGWRVRHDALLFANVAFLSSIELARLRRLN